ncbi:MAG: hypothetical protein ABIA76_03530 [Candidatus Diapherotrites archaeon]
MKSNYSLIVFGVPALFFLLVLFNLFFLKLDLFFSFVTVFIVLFAVILCYVLVFNKKHLIEKKGYFLKYNYDSLIKVHSNIVIKIKEKKEFEKYLIQILSIFKEYFQTENFVVEWIHYYENKHEHKEKKVKFTQLLEFCKQFEEKDTALETISAKNENGYSALTYNRNTRTIEVTSNNRFIHYLVDKLK